MTRVVKRNVRSAMMSGRPAKNTGPEMAVREALRLRGFQFRANDRRLLGKPDIVLSQHRVIVHVNGCYWHGHRGCRYFKWPKSNKEFWKAKVLANRRRDLVVQYSLRQQGWRQIILWECAIRDNSDRALAKLVSQIGKRQWRVEISGANRVKIARNVGSRKTTQQPTSRRKSNT